LQATMLAEQYDALQTGGLCFQITLNSMAPYRNPFVREDLQVINLPYATLERLSRSNAPHLVLYETVRQQVPLGRLCPYDTTREARGAMFFGRRSELDQLVDDSQTSFLVTGARRV